MWIVSSSVGLAKSDACAWTPYHGRRRHFFRAAHEGEAHAVPLIFSVVHKAELRVRRDHRDHAQVADDLRSCHRRSSEHPCCLPLKVHIAPCCGKRVQESICQATDRNELLCMLGMVDTSTLSINTFYCVQGWYTCLAASRGYSSPCQIMLLRKQAWMGMQKCHCPR